MSGMRPDEIRVCDGIALVALAADGPAAQPTSWQKVAIEGEWMGHWMGGFSLDRSMFKQMVANFKAQQVDTVVDYEHSTLWGDQAKAAGWVDELQLRDGDGGEAELWARIRWNNAAAEMIREREYRYLSPTIAWYTRNRRSGELTGASLHSIALTNVPFLEELPEVRLNSFRAALGGTAKQEEKTMNEHLMQIVALLGLAAETPEKVVEAVKALSQRVTQQAATIKAVFDRLGLSAGATDDEAIAAVVALQNPAGYVKAEEFNALRDRLEQQEAERLVGQALDAGKINNDEKARSWALEYARRDPAGFRAFCDVAPPVVPMERRQQRTTEQRPAADAALSEVDKQYAGELGLSEDEVSKYNKPPYV